MEKLQKIANYIFYICSVILIILGVDAIVTNYMVSSRVYGSTVLVLGAIVLLSTIKENIDIGRR